LAPTRKPPHPRRVDDARAEFGRESGHHCGLARSPGSVPMTKLAIAFLIALGITSAQVEKVTMRTTGISCGICAAVSEIRFRLMSPVDSVTISLPAESITLTYKPGADFVPSDLRQVLQPLDVGVVQFTITMRGRIVEEAGARFFATGKQRFVLRPSEKFATVPNRVIRIDAVVYDHRDPMELKVLAWH
jgi:hypothetical protein